MKVVTTKRTSSRCPQLASRSSPAAAARVCSPRPGDDARFQEMHPELRASV